MRIKLFSIINIIVVISIILLFVYIIYNNGGLESTPRNITLIEEEVHNLVNIYREHYNLNSLSYNNKLVERARNHSKNMSMNNFFEHDELRGREIGENIGLTPIGLVEGCGSVYSEYEIAKCTVDGWMLSEGHRENILTNWFNCEAIGVSISEYDEVYITQKFC